MTLAEELRQVQRLPAPAKARAIREAAGVSQERLAAELGVHRITVARWEAGERRPRGSGPRGAYADLIEQLRQELRTMTLETAPDVLTVVEAARLLRVGRNQAYELVNRGELFGRRIGRSIRIPKSALIAYLEGPGETIP